MKPHPGLGLVWAWSSLVLEAGYQLGVQGVTGGLIAWAILSVQPLETMALGKVGA